MKIFIYSTIDPALQDQLKKQAPSESEVIFKSNLSKDEIQKAFATTEVLMGNPPASWFDKPLPSLKFWQIDSAGFNQYKNIELDIPVANMGDFFAHECAETMVAGILAFYRGINYLTKFQLQKEWKGQQIRNSLENLGDKKTLILGSGAIGLAIKKMLLGFGTEVKTTARKNPVADIHSFDDVLNELPKTDLVINTLPGTADKYVSKSFLDAMKRGSVYTNVGRGNTTDEKALIENLKTKKLAGAILDVTETEPLAIDNPLWDMENVILTQHTAGGSTNEMQGKIERFITNLTKFSANEKIENLIDLKTGY